jgi:hypothetical protein
MKRLTENEQTYWAVLAALLTAAAAVAAWSVLL